MEKLSRVKKYEELRKNIEDDTTQSGTEAHGNKLSSYANQLNDIDPMVFKKVKIKEESDYVPERQRRNDYFQDELDTPIASFTNEYLDDFISEVKDYNIKKGNRENENTEMDILSQLQNVTRKRAQYIEPMKETAIEEPSDITNTMSREDIAKQVQELLLEESTQAPVEVAPQTSEVRSEDTVVYEKMPDTSMEPLKREYVDPMHARLVEETQQLRVQLDEYEGELTDLNDGIDKTNRILNIILCTLIFVLIFVIGIIVYWLVKEGGILS